VGGGGIGVFVDGIDVGILVGVDCGGISVGDIGAEVLVGKLMGVWVGNKGVDRAVGILVGVCWVGTDGCKV
jgi:hypothetical protein